MKKLTTICVALVLVGAATGSVSQAASTKACGTLTGFYGKAKIRAQRNISCAAARRVFRDYFAGKGRKHQGSNHANSYTAVDGWKCGTATGASGCSRGATFIQARYPRG